MKTIEQQIKEISSLVNRSENQCKFLLDLCGNDMEKYLLFETYIIAHNNHSFVPGDVETLNAYMAKKSLDKVLLYTKKGFYR